MKFKILISITLASFFLWNSCEPPVVFKEAQPQGVKSQSSFDEQYQGTYFCESDSSWVKVEPTTIYKEKTFFFVSSRSEMEENEYIELNGNVAYIEYFDKYVTLEKFDGDLMSGKVTLRDTFFEIGEKGILKNYKGNEIMNTQFEDGHWQVEILKLDRYGNLSFLRSKEPEDIEALEEITPINTLVHPDGGTQYEITPSKAEFKQILKNELVFEECDYFIRVRTRENL